MKNNTNTPSNNANNTNNVNLNEVLVSRDFKNAVVKIASIYGMNVHSDIFPDLMQVCSIACIDAAKLYNPSLCGGNFLGYAYTRMFEYAKNEVFNQRNIVHIPANHIYGRNGYEKVSHEYYDLFRPNDGHEHTEYAPEDEFVADTYNDELSVSTCNSGLTIDLRNALNNLNSDERMVFELMSGLRKFSDNSGSITIKKVAKETGMSVKNVKLAYDSAVASMRAYLA